MIIKSSFKDYYDCGMQLGYHGAIYNREQSYVDSDIIIPRHLNWWNHDYKNKKRYDTDVIPFLLSVCGKLYPGVHYIIVDETWNNTSFKWDRVCVTKTVYSIDQIDMYKYDYEDFFNLRYKRFFTDKETYPYPSTDKLHEKLQCPLLMFMTVKNKSQVKLNPKLSCYNFQQIMNPLELFQTIEMWFNNLVSPEKPIPEISNEDLIEAKGFDLKSSFRKEKQGKKT